MATLSWRRHHRHPYHNHHHLKAGRYHIVSALSFLSGAALLLLALISFLTPAPPSSDHPVAHLKGTKSAGPDARRSAIEEEAFRVPSGGGNAGKDLWRSTSSKFYYGCSNSAGNFPDADVVTQSNRYLMIATSGGLNQQRTGKGGRAISFVKGFRMCGVWGRVGLGPQKITDAVVAARILNATLVVPKLDQKSFWKDASDFDEIFDVDWFISALSKDVKVIKLLPKKGGKVIGSPYTMRVPRKCTPKCYQNRVLPVLLKKRVVQLTKFDYRLSNRLDIDLQKLRCRVNYHALKFTDPILEMGRVLTHRMREKSNHFIALHLRFEPDMLAFSGCYYGGGDKERTELGAIRKRWKTLHTKNPEKERRHGKCPLTPEEVGLMLRALGFGSDVHIYVASALIYGGDETLAPLRALFPNFHSKESLATKEELAPFSSFSSRMAALDFIVCDESDVFVTNNNGNMARILAGRRRYFGHKRTIRPNAKKLYSLFLNRASMTWETFALKVRTSQKGFMGEPNEVRPGRGEFHENPSACLCERTEVKAQMKFETNRPGESSGYLSDEEPELSDPDYPDAYVSPNNRVLPNDTEIDYEPLIKPEDAELDDLLSD